MTLMSNAKPKREIREINNVQLNYVYSIINTPNYYYVAEEKANLIFVLDKNWTFVKSYNYTSPKLMKQIRNDVFISSSNDLSKLNASFHIIKTHRISTENSNIQFSYDYETDKFLITYSNPNNKAITCDYNLNTHITITKFEFQSYPMTLTLKSDFVNGKSIKTLLVGLKNGKLQKYNCESNIKFSLVNTYEVCSGEDYHEVSSILLFPDDYMIIACKNDEHEIKLYYKENITFTGKSLSLPNNPLFVDINEDNQLIVTLENNGIYIYSL